MALEVGSSSPQILPPDVSADPALSYSRHYAKKIHDLGKSSRETWIQTLVDHVLHGPHPGRLNHLGGQRRGRGGKSDREMERLFESNEHSPNMHQRRKDHLGMGFDLAGATSRRNGRIMNSLTDSPYLPKTKIPQETPVYLRKIVQTREGYREMHHRSSRESGIVTTRGDKDDDKSSMSSSYKPHNYPPIKSTMFREPRLKLFIPQELATSPYVSQRQNVRIVPIEKVLAPRPRPRPHTRQSGARKSDSHHGGGGGVISNQRSTNPYLQSAPAHSHPHPNHLTEAWRPSALPTTTQILALEKRAKAHATKAVKENKIFTCEGPYPVDAYVRFSMRKRGWVEKFAPKIHNTIATGKGTSSKLECELDEDFDVICERNVPPPWEEEHGVYAIMSRLVRHRPARFIWAGRAVNSMVLHQDVIVNHFPKARHFSSKTGIASSLRDLPWLASSDPMDFFPRCYLLSEDEREDLIEDFRMCACISLLKWVMSMFTTPEDMRRDKTIITDRSKTIEVIHEEEREATAPRLSACHNINQSEDKESGQDDTNDESAEQNAEETCHNEAPPEMRVHVADLENNNLDLGEDVGVADYRHGDDPDFARQSESDDDDSDGDIVDKVSSPLLGKVNNAKRIRPVITKHERLGGEVPSKAVDWALNQCERYIRFKAHDDLDQRNKPNLSTAQWDQFLKWYYKVAHDGATVTVTESKVKRLKEVLSKMRKLWKQFDIDGMRNLWIIKPGGKSKGIGIEFCTNIEDMMKYIDNTTLTGTYVVQKYIETPCLIYNTKFDIRQWFVVTDWNPLTIWFYKGSYLRICSQEFTMDSMHEAVHLSNVAIQQFYLNGDREGNLPEDNYMNSEEFEEYLGSRGAPNAWENIVYPGMINGVVNTLLATSDIAENKKAAFELYGADFMLADNYTPWLLEINSSPGMAPTTKEKAKMCATVVEDLMKVVLDRRDNKNCDTGNFELVFKDQPMPSFKSVDNRMFIEGSRIKRTDLQRYSSLDNVVKSGEDPSKNEFLKQLRNKQNKGQGKDTAAGRPGTRGDGTRDYEDLRTRAVQKQEPSRGQTRGTLKGELSIKDQALTRSYTKIYGSGKQLKVSNSKPPTSKNPLKMPNAQPDMARSGKDGRKKDNSTPAKSAKVLKIPAKADKPDVDDTEEKEGDDDEETEEETEEEEEEETEVEKEVDDEPERKAQEKKAEVEETDEEESDEYDYSDTEAESSSDEEVIEESKNEEVHTRKIDCSKEMEDQHDF